MPVEKIVYGARDYSSRNICRGFLAIRLIIIGPCSLVFVTKECRSTLFMFMKCCCSTDLNFHQLRHTWNGRVR